MRLVPERNEQNSNDPAVIEVDSTLLRDYFAGQALQLFTSELLRPGGDAVAKFCYDLADAMMKERARRGI